MCALAFWWPPALDDTSTYFSYHSTVIAKRFGANFEELIVAAKFHCWMKGYETGVFSAEVVLMNTK